MTKSVHNSAKSTAEGRFEPGLGEQNTTLAEIHLGSPKNLNELEQLAGVVPWI